MAVIFTIWSRCLSARLRRELRSSALSGNACPWRRRNSRTVCDARHEVNPDTWVDVRLKIWACWGVRGTTFRQDNDPWLHISFLRCTEKCGYILPVAVIVAYYVDVSSCNLPASSMESVELDKPVYRLHVRGHFDYWVKKTYLNVGWDLGAIDVASSTGIVLIPTPFLCWSVQGCLFSSQNDCVLMSDHGYYLCRGLLLWRTIQIW